MRGEEFIVARELAHGLFLRSWNELYCHWVVLRLYLSHFQYFTKVQQHRLAGLPKCNCVRLCEEAASFSLHSLRLRSMLCLSEFL